MRSTWWLAVWMALAMPVLAEGPEEKEPREEAVSPSEEREVLDYVGSKAPEMKEHLSRVKEARPEMYRQRMREMARMVRDPEMREHFAKMHDSRRRVQKLVESYREDKGDAKSKDAVKKDLEKAVGDVFDMDVAQKEVHIKKMQTEISKLKEKIAKRRSMKDQLVKKRVEKLVGEGDEWEW